MQIGQQYYTSTIIVIHFFDKKYLPARLTSIVLRRKKIMTQKKIVFA